ncbi:MAG: tRNA uridine-5-carboxymethylaminomethyl(34) synthesis GTPase MnmE [Pseudomonadota bacterium]
MSASLEDDRSNHKRADAGSLDTIVAVATASGHAGIGVVRLSGPRSKAIAETVCGGVLIARHAHHRQFSDSTGTIIDDGIALWFAGPASYTGEDLVELQGHGNPVLLDALVLRCCELGARLARPGEFTERAFLNDRLDLTQAEAVADVINASTVGAARAAIRSLQGEFSTAADQLVKDLITLRVHVESAFDFPDEDIDFLAEAPVRDGLAALRRDVQALEHKARAGMRLQDGAVVVLAGQPNAGKSSLLNRLATRDIAIVTDIPGTTRDVLKITLDINGLPVELVDTAGMRDAQDAIEQEGVRRTRVQLEEADAVLLVYDISQGATQADHDLASECGATPVCWVGNKADLLTSAPVKPVDNPRCEVSALTGEGMDALRQRIADLLSVDGEFTGGTVSARRRHLAALHVAIPALQRAEETLHTGVAGELVAEELRIAQEALESLSGRFTADDLLGEIFSTFCIGK